MVRNNALPPVHPGEIIREDVLPEAGLSVTATAKALGVSRQTVHGVPRGPETAICRHVPEDRPIVREHSGILDASSSRLRSEDRGPR